MATWDYAILSAVGSRNRSKIASARPGLMGVRGVVKVERGKQGERERGSFAHAFGVFLTESGVETCENDDDDIMVLVKDVTQVCE